MTDRRWLFERYFRQKGASSLSC